MSAQSAPITDLAAEVPVFVRNVGRGHPKLVWCAALFGTY
jgi:hypothetical protein